MTVPDVDTRLTNSDVGDGFEPTRRIVTGEDSDGRSYFVSDGHAPNIVKTAHSPTVAQVLWATGEAAAQGAEPAPANHNIGFHSEGGSVLRIVDFAPDDQYDHSKLAEFLDEHGVRDTSSPRHFWFHKTPSLDYAIVLEGEIYAMLDIGEKLMRAGDVLIQCGTNHSWSNRSGRTCRMAFVLLAQD